MSNLTATFFSNDNAVDRVEETEYILNELNNNVSNVLMIYSISGVGKSTLTNRICKNITGKLPICVRTNPENKTGNVTEGFFLSKIFNLFVRIFQTNKKQYPKCTFEYYLSHDKNNFVKKKALEKMFGEIETDTLPTSLGLSISKYFISRLFQIYEYNPSTNLALPDRDSMLVASNYIKYVMSQQELCLIIDNLQNIDFYSMQLLTDWMATTPKERKNFFVFEYTIEAPGKTDKIFELAKNWQAMNLDVKLLALDGLAPENAIEALQKIHPTVIGDNNFFKEAKKYYLYRSCGSLQKLLDFSLQYGKNSILNDTYDPTFERINSIDSTSKFIFAIVVLHSGQIEKTILKTIAENSVSPVILNYPDNINKLTEEYELLSENDNICQIKHASLIDSWNNNKFVFEKYNLLAYRNCVKHYKRLFSQSHYNIDKKEQALLFLLRVYAQYEPENLPQILDKITALVSERILPDNIWQYYLIFLEYIDGSEQKFRSVLYRMAEFCFNQNMYKNCLYLLQILEKIPGENSTDEFMIYKINCIEYLELHEEAIELCKQRLQAVHSARQRYIYYLLLMGCYRSLNLKDEYLRCVTEIKNIVGYEGFPEYGIFLRLSEIYMNRDEAIPFVKKSVEFFERKGLRLLEAKSRITYSFLLAVTNAPDKALEELDICKTLLEPCHCWQNVLALNQASVMLIQKRYGEEIRDLLKKAELSTNSPFDLLLILTMQLINNIETNDSVNNPYLLRRILPLLEHETDKHLIALVSYNLSVAFRRLNKPELAEKYNYIAVSVKEYNRSVECHLDNTVDTHTPILFQTEWCIGFTFFWNVDYIDREFMS